MKQSVCFEELLVAIDAAGILQGDDMRGNANPQSFAPSFAHSIEEVSVVYASNLDALGKSAAYAILSGTAFPDGPHQILLGAAGGENVDLANEAVGATVLKDMGIRVNPGGEYIVQFEETGDTVDEGVCVIQLQFNSRSPRQPKKWTASAIETAVVNTNVQGQNLAQANALIAPGASREIGSIIKCAAMDFDPLGCHAAVCILSQGCSPTQEILCGGGGGELIIGAGSTVMPTQEVDCQYTVTPNQGIYVEFRGVGEAGTIMGAVSLGLVV